MNPPLMTSVTFNTLDRQKRNQMTNGQKTIDDDKRLYFNDIKTVIDQRRRYAFITLINDKE